MFLIDQNLNIAWIEATYAGAATIGPAWQEWQHTGILNYSSVEETGKTIGFDFKQARISARTCIFFTRRGSAYERDCRFTN